MLTKKRVFDKNKKSIIAIKEKWGMEAMSQDTFTLFEKVTTGKLMEAISKSMDDFLYIFDIQNSKLELSEAAVDRFMIPGRFLDDPLSAVYEEVRCL